LKILLKFAFSLLKDDELNEYKNIKSVLLNDDIPNITKILDITSRTPFDWNSVILYENKFKDDDKYVDNILTLNFNMKKYIIFFNKDNKKTELSENIIREDYIKLFNDIDIYNWRIRDFNNERIQIKFNLDIFMEFIKNKII
jgi:DNA polymerase III delta prime subunit